MFRKRLNIARFMNLRNTKIPRRQFCSFHDRNAKYEKSMLRAGLAVIVFWFGASYAFVPLYQIFCQATGFGGTTQADASAEKLKAHRERVKNDPSLAIDKDRTFEVDFDSTTDKKLPWTFRPMQRRVYVAPGESALVFFKAKNTSDRAITGVSTYNVNPDKIGVYFNKIQCFCFEQQRLLPGEEIDMPVLFYIDPAILDDNRFKNMSEITLSYTFFEIDRDDETD